MDIYMIIALTAALLLIIAAISISVYMKRRQRNRHELERLISSGNQEEKIRRLNEILMPFGFEYNKESDIFQSIEDGWQKKFGYSRLYDEAAAIMRMIIDCEPVRFEYDGRHWLIEFWKGQYGMLTGAEIGVYVSDSRSPFLKPVFYDAADSADYQVIGMNLRKKGELMFQRIQRHWWLTGFVPGEYSRPYELVMEISILFYDLGLMEAFVEALRRLGYGDGDMSIKHGMVQVRFEKPYSRQPFSRYSPFNAIRSCKNKRYCRLYVRLSGRYKTTVDRIEALRLMKPRAYRYLTGTGRFSGRLEKINTNIRNGV